MLKKILKFGAILVGCSILIAKFSASALKSGSKKIVTKVANEGTGTLRKFSKTAPRATILREMKFERCLHRHQFGKAGDILDTMRASPRFDTLEVELFAKRYQLAFDAFENDLMKKLTVADDFPVISNEVAANASMIPPPKSASFARARLVSVSSIGHYSQLIQLSAIKRLFGLHRLTLVKAQVKAFGQAFRKGASKQREILSKLTPEEIPEIAQWRQVPESKRVFLIGSGDDVSDIAKFKKSLEADGHAVFFYKFATGDAGRLAPSEVVGAFFGSAGKSYIYRPVKLFSSDYIKVEAEIAKRVLQKEKNILMVTPREVLATTVAGGTGTSVLVIGVGDTARQLEEIQSESEKYMANVYHTIFSSRLEGGIKAFAGESYEDAANNWALALKIAEKSTHPKISNPSIKRMLMMNLAVCDIKLGQFEAGIAQLEKILAELERDKIRSELAARVRFHLACTFKNPAINRLDESKSLLKTSLGIYQELEEGNYLEDHFNECKNLALSLGIK